MSARESIEIDFCPQCRDVWLDRGELDKILERSQREPAAACVSGTCAAGQRPAGLSGRLWFKRWGIMDRAATRTAVAS